MQFDDTTSPEELFLSFIEEGSIAITPEGHVVRLINRCNGKRLDVPRRIEYLGKQRGYLQVVTKHRGKTMTLNVHRLVYRHFHGPIPDNLEINHRNGIKTDNRPENLEIVTNSENQRHAIRNGLKVPKSGESHWRSALSDAHAAEIRRAYSTGAWTQQELADRFGVSRLVVNNLVRGKSRVRQAGPIVTHDLRRKLDERQVREILDLWETTTLTKHQIGERFGVTRHAISYVLRRSGVTDARDDREGN